MTKTHFGVALALTAIVAVGAAIAWSDYRSPIAGQLHTPSGEVIRHPSLSRPNPSTMASAHVSEQASPPLTAASSKASADSPASKKKGTRFTDGVAAVEAIDWEKVTTASPIPSPMPARRAVDAVDAGFAPEWFDRSLGGWRAESQRFQGKYAYVSVEPMALQIMSQSKNPDDAWANGMETDLNSLAVSNTPANVQVVTRVFCNAVGCLFYVGDEGDQLLDEPVSKVLSSLRDDPMWAQTYGIKPLTFYRIGSKTWDLILIERPGSGAPASKTITP